MCNLMEAFDKLIGHYNELLTKARSIGIKDDVHIDYLSKLIEHTTNERQLYINSIIGHSDGIIIYDKHHEDTKNNKAVVDRGLVGIVDMGIPSDEFEFISDGEHDMSCPRCRGTNSVLDYSASKKANRDVFGPCRYK